MRFEKCTTSTVNKLYKNTKLQALLDEFMASNEAAVRCVLSEDEYASLASAHSSISKAANRLRYPIKARVMDGSLYLIRTDSKEVSLNG